MHIDIDEVLLSKTQRHEAVNDKQRLHDVRSGKNMTEE